MTLLIYNEQGIIAEASELKGKGVTDDSILHFFKHPEADEFFMVEIFKEDFNLKTIKPSDKILIKETEEDEI